MPISKTTLGLSMVGGGDALVTVQKVVDWFLDGRTSPRPPAVSEMIAGLIILGAGCWWHWLQNRDPIVAQTIQSNLPSNTDASP